MEQIGLEAVFLTSEFSAGVSAYVRGIGEAERRTDRFERSASLRFAAVAGAVAGLSAAITNTLIRALGDALRHLARLAVGGVQSAAALEQQMADIESVLYATTSQMEDMRDVAIEIGLDPRLKASVTDVADVMEMLARNGVEVEDILGGIALQTIALANATGGDFEQSARIATDAQILFNLATADFADIANLVTGVVNNSKMTMNDYAYALANAGGVVSTAGLSFLDFNTIVAAISPNFKSGREAGTSIKRMFQNLVPASGNAADAMQRVGLLTFDATRAMEILRQNGIQPMGSDIRTLVEQLYGMAQNLGYITQEGAGGEKQFQDYVKQLQVMRNAFFETNGELKSGVEIVAEIQKAFGGLNAMQVTELTTDIFGTDSIQTVTALLRLTREDYIALMQEISKTSAIDSAQIRMATFEGSMEILKETIDATGIAIGLKLLPALTDLALLFASMIAGRSSQMINFFTVLGTVMQDFVGELAAGTPLIFAFTSGLGELFRELGYAPSSVRLLEESIVRVVELITGTFAQAMALLTQHSVALSGALAGVVAAFAGLSIISAIGGAITFALSPIGQLIIVAGVLGAVWNTNFLGMRDVTLWFVDAIMPAVSAVIAFGNSLGGIIGSLAQDFQAGFNGMVSATATGASAIGQLMQQLGHLAAGWGTGLVNVIAAGIIAAVGAVVQAINYLGSIIAYWMAPSSPPRFLPDLDDWGTDAAGVYLDGWTQADFDALLDFGQDVGAVLRSMISADEIGQNEGLDILEAVRTQMAAALQELNTTGSVSEATFDAIRNAGGAAGEEIEGFARRYIGLNQAIEAATAANERLTAATQEQKDAQEAIDDIKERLTGGDTSVTMDEIKTARARMIAARKEQKLAEDINDVAQDGLKVAQSELDLYAARIGVQTESFNIMGQMLGVASEIAKKEKEGLTALELQIKRMEMMQQHYRDRHRMAELDAIMADENATAEEKKSAELEKQLILLQMQQREVEAFELGFDISEVWDWPIVLKENIEKARKAAADAKPDFDGIAAGMMPLPGLATELASGLETIKDNTNNWRIAMDAVTEAIGTAKGILDTLLGGGEILPNIPGVAEFNAFLDRLQQPIVIPTIDFTGMTPPEWLNVLMGAGADLSGVAEQGAQIANAFIKGLTEALMTGDPTNVKAFFGTSGTYTTAFATSFGEAQTIIIETATTIFGPTATAIAAEMRRLFDEALALAFTAIAGNTGIDIAGLLTAIAPEANAFTGTAKTLMGNIAKALEEEGWGQSIAVFREFGPSAGEAMLESITEMLAIVTAGTGPSVELFATTLSEQISTALNTALTDFAANLDAATGMDFSGMFDGIGEAFKEIEPHLGSIMGALAGLGLSMKYSFAPLLALLGLVMHPFAALLVVVGGLIAVGAGLFSSWDSVVATFGFLTEIMKPLVDGVFVAFQTLLEQIEPIAESLGRVWEAWLPTLKVVGGILGALLVGALGLIYAAILGIVRGLSPAIKTISLVFQSLMLALEGVGNFISGIVNLVGAFLHSDLEGVADALKQMGLGVLQFIFGLGYAIGHFLGGVVETVRVIVDGFVDGIIIFFTNLYNSLVGHSIIPDMVNGIIEWFTTLDDRLLAFAEGIYNNLVLWFTTAFTDLVLAVEGFYDDTVEWFEELGIEIESAVDLMWTAVQTMFTTHFGNFMTSVGTLISDILAVFNDTDWGKLGRDLVVEIADAIVNNLGRIGQAARDLVNHLISAALAAIGISTGGPPKAVGEPPDPAVPTNAAGTPSWRGGLTWVGEQGAELVSYMQRSFLAGLNGPVLLNLPSGAEILSHAATEARLRRDDSLAGLPVSSSVTNNRSSVYNTRNTRNYYVSTSSTPMQIDRALAVSELLDS